MGDTNLDILNQLNFYCNELIGESPSKQKEDARKSEAISKIITKTSNSLKRSKKSDATKLKVQNQSLKKLEKEHLSKEFDTSICKGKRSPHLETEDGFKIISDLPPDDSDVSDAFCSDIEDGSDDEVTNKLDESNRKETDDGFRIVSHIEADDSDISDAFECDIDESQWLSEAQDRKKVKNVNKLQQQKLTESTKPNSSKSLPSKFKSIKKPLLKIIQDFDLEDRLYMNNDSEARLKMSKKAPPLPVVKSKKCLSNEELNIIDYSIKRGKRKAEVKEEAKHNKTQKHNNTKNSSNSPQISKQEAEKSFKKARYEIFKFGMSGFEKKEQKDAKVNLAVKLGAKPPKKESINYKKLINERKLEKEKEMANREEQRHFGLPVKKVQPEKPKRGLNINPPIGKFKGGVLSLSEKEIKQINAQKL